MQAQEARRPTPRVKRDLSEARKRYKRFLEEASRYFSDLVDRLRDHFGLALDAPMAPDVAAAAESARTGPDFVSDWVFGCSLPVPIPALPACLPGGIRKGFEYFCKKGGG